MGMPEHEEPGGKAAEEAPLLLVGGLGDPSDEAGWEETQRKVLHDFSIYGGSIDSASPATSDKGWIMAISVE